MAKLQQRTIFKQTCLETYIETQIITRTHFLIIIYYCRKKTNINLFKIILRVAIFHKRPWFELLN